MRIAVLFAALLTGCLVQAQTTKAPFELTCVTSPVPTTSFVAVEQGEDVMMSLVHHNGLEYMPIHEGIVTPNDLPRLAERARILKDLGPILNARFPKNKCKNMGDQIIHCENYGAKEQPLGGHQVAFLSFYTNRVTDVSFAGTYRYLVGNLFLEIDKEKVFLSMRYFEPDCVSRQMRLPPPGQ